MSYNGIIFFLKQEVQLTPMSHPALCLPPFWLCPAVTLPKAPELTSLCPVPAEPVLVPGSAGRHPGALL